MQCYPALKSVLTTEEQVQDDGITSHVIVFRPGLADIHTEFKNTTAEQEANTKIYKTQQVHIFGAWDFYTQSFCVSAAGQLLREHLQIAS